MAGPTDATRAQRARARPRLLGELARAGRMPCPRCPDWMYPWQDLDVGHPEDVADVGTAAALRMDLRLEHRSCNREAGDRRWRRPAPTPQEVYSREW